MFKVYGIIAGSPERMLGYARENFTGVHTTFNLDDRPTDMADLRRSHRERNVCHYVTCSDEAYGCDVLYIAKSSSLKESAKVMTSLNKLFVDIIVDAVEMDKSSLFRKMSLMELNTVESLILYSMMYDGSDCNLREHMDFKNPVVKLFLDSHLFKQFMELKRISNDLEAHMLVWLEQKGYL